MATKEQKVKRSVKGSTGGRDGHRKVGFRVEAPAGSKVFVAGTFNDWNPASDRLRKNGDGNYAAELMLIPGRYEYKFVINGEWRMDADNPVWEPNREGSLNSVVEVRAE